MTTQELRIGNYVQTDNSTQHFIDIVRINSICDYAINIEEGWPDGTPSWEWQLDSIHPIELTEEWLINFGFTKKDDCYYLKGFKVCFFEGVSISYHKTHLFEIKGFHVHKLQNLYYGIKQEELEINK